MLFHDLLNASAGLLYGHKCFCSHTEGEMHPPSWNGLLHRLRFCRDTCMLLSFQGCLIYCLGCVFVCKSDSCCIDAETLTPYGWRKPQPTCSALGVCRVPGLGQSAPSSAGSAGPLTISSCCPLFETILQLVVNPVNYTPIIIRLLTQHP